MSLRNFLSHAETKLHQENVRMRAINKTTDVPDQNCKGFPVKSEIYGIFPDLLYHVSYQHQC